MNIQKEARELLKKLSNTYEVFSDRLPLCKGIEAQLEKEFPKVPKESILHMLNYVKNSKEYKLLISQGYPSYDLYGDACNSTKVQKPALPIPPHRRNTRPETPHKAKVYVRHARRTPTQDNCLGST